MSYGEMVGFKNKFGYGGITPLPCSKLVVKHENESASIKWNDSKDTIIDGNLLCSWNRTVIVRKKGDYPTSLTDGKQVLVNSKRDYYATTPFIDSDFELGDTPSDFYYMAFPQSDTGATSINERNQFKTDVYSFRKVKNNSNPSTRIEYTGNTTVMDKAYMDYESGTFNYGSWKNAFFMPKPCMLNYNGNVEYYLKETDYTKKEDGSASDVANTDFAGNAMMEFPTVWLYIYQDDEYEYYNISDKQIDSNYKCYAHHDANGNIMPYTYMPIYNGANVSSKLRSISGLAPLSGTNAQTEINYATENGDNWNIEVLADRMLVNVLLMLIGKSTDTQAVFGNGNYTGGVSASNTLATGTMNTKGLFYGSSATTGTRVGVKVFGMENYWGNIWRRIAGWINDNGTQKVKMTYGTEDGSTVQGYNLTGDGYIPLIGLTPAGTSGGYISKTSANQYGVFPYQASGSQTMYETDGMYFDNSQVNAFAAVGGGSGSGFICGAFSMDMSSAAIAAAWYFGASPSCKPTVDA